jgi:hypothetical protein
MNVVILAGGTGSQDLQKSLYSIFDETLDGVETRIIVNAYDDGLSTGTARRVMNGAILGSSDIRKNQFTRLQLHFEGPSLINEGPHRPSAIIDALARKIMKSRAAPVAREHRKRP